MSTSTIIELEASKVRFFSPHDEEAFFEWLNKLPCVENYIGQRDVLHIRIIRSAVG